MSFVTDSILKTALGKIKAWGEGKFVAQETGKGLSSNDYTSAEKTKLSGIAEGANKYVHPSYTAQKSGLYKVTVDASGHVSATTAVAKADITGLGIPAQDTTYADATTSTHGLMSAADKTKLDGVTKEIASAVSGVTQIDYSVVEALPSTGKKGVIYLVANSGSGNNIYDEYIYINSKLGSREMDLSSYAKKTDIPTKVSSLTNDSGYQTAAQVTSAIDAKLVVMTDTELNTMWTEVFGA